MLDKERWIYDPARCLRKTCKFPMLADSQLGNYFLKGHKPFIVDDDEEKEDDLYVRPKVKISRKLRNEINRDVADEEKDDEDSEASVIPISKPKRKRSEQTVRIDVPLHLLLLRLAVQHHCLVEVMSVELLVLLLVAQIHRWTHHQSIRLLLVYLQELHSMMR